jgi:radical SAM superfamily enzyme YgiQ (UPF0313 family)
MTTFPVLQGMNEAASARAAVARKLRGLIKSPCQRVLIVNPPQISEGDFLIERALNNRYWIYPPYGPGILCRSLGVRGYETELLDLNFEVLRSAHELQEQFNYQIWREKLQQKLDEFCPDIVGMSCMFTMTHAIMKEITEAIKAHDQRLPIIAGGVHLTNASKLILEDCRAIDFIGLKEGDNSFPDMLDVVNGKLPASRLMQVATLINGTYTEIGEGTRPDEEAIETSPLYHNLPIGDYHWFGQIGGTYGRPQKGRPATSILRERGCRARCSFCSVRNFNGAGVRERNYLNVADEIQGVVERYGITHITWLDDDPLSDPQGWIALHNEIVRRNLKITWDATNGLIAAFVTDEIAAAMVASGCVGFNLGIESGNDEVLRACHKPGTTDSFRKCMAIMKQYPQVFVKAFLMIGFPPVLKVGFRGETLSMMLDTVKLCHELQFDWGNLQVLNPLPGTEVYGIMIEQGLIQDGLDTGPLAFLNGAHGRQKLVQDRQRLTADEFFDLFNVCPLDEVPPKHMLGDLWFLMDYMINYHQLVGISDPIKLTKIRTMLVDICDRIAPDSPMGWLFKGIVDQKLEKPELARTVIPVTRHIVDGSAYWQKRFDTLQLNPLLEKLDSETRI